MEDPKAERIAIITIIVAILLIVLISFAISKVVKNRRQAEETRQTPVGDEEKEIIKKRINESFDINWEDFKW